MKIRQTTRRWLSHVFPQRYPSLATLLESQTELSFQSLRKHLFPIYWLCVLAAVLAAWGFEEYYANAKYNTLYVRLAVCAIGLPLFLSPYPKNTLLARYQRLYFSLFVTLLLPVMFSWNALANASLAADIDSLSGAWLTEYSLATFIFLGLFSSPIYSVIICFLVLFLMSCVALVTFSPETDAFFGTILFMVAAIITALLFLLTTHQQLNYILEHRLETAYSIGSRVAHELRTPLLSIKNFALAAKRSAEADQKDNEALAKQIAPHLQHILSEVNFSNRMIDILLVSTTKAPFNFDQDETFKAGDVIDKAISSYPYANSAERKSVIAPKGSNFEAYGPAELMVHSLYNLIKNALLSRNIEDQASVVIENYSLGKKGVITVTDNGPGIPLRLQRKVFDDFFTTRNAGDGTGLGLAFCKSLMMQIGGKIDYKREANNSIFRMTFPLNNRIHTDEVDLFSSDEP